MTEQEGRRRRDREPELYLLDPASLPTVGDVRSFVRDDMEWLRQVVDEFVTGIDERIPEALGSDARHAASLLSDDMGTLVAIALDGIESAPASASGLAQADFLSPSERARMLQALVLTFYMQCAVRGFDPDVEVHHRCVRHLCDFIGGEEAA